MEKDKEILWEFLIDFSRDKASIVSEAIERTESKGSQTLCIERFNGRKTIHRGVAVLQH